MDAAPPITWAPTDAQRGASRLGKYLEWLREKRGIPLGEYRAAWQWSVDDPNAFWDSIWEYFDIVGERGPGPALGNAAMPGAEWFLGARLNWAENILRHSRDPERADKPAIIAVGEDDTTTELTWRELERQVAALATVFVGFGVGKGDRVAGVLPNIPETIVALLACASVGAVWTVSSPDLSAPGTLDRLRQLAPKVLIGVDGYRFNGKRIDKSEHFAEVLAGLPTVEQVVIVPVLGGPVAAGTHDFEQLVAGPAQPHYERLAFEHPLWVLFSSGTTGNPKGIVHSHGGITVEAWKGMALQQDLGPGDRYYVGANTSWMVWNLLVTALISGASIVTYSGSPTWGRPDRQFAIVAATGVTVFGVGAAYLSLIERAGATPGRDFDLSSLRSIQSTASPLPPGTWRWVHDAIKADLHLGSDSGGTDICSGFIGSNPLDPVYLGELQGAYLGVAIEAWSAEGVRLVGEVGEMVITRPLPSMPIYFWGDDNGAKYRASYFEQFPGVWSHGDWITETVRGTFVVHGRSDATLNRAGVRLGSADIYAAVDTFAEVAGSLVVGVERPGGDYYMPLFVVPADGVTLDDALRERITDRIRERASARHVPDEIVLAPAIPISHAGKRLEVAVKRLLAGMPVEKAVNRSTLANPECIDWYVEFARQHGAGAS